VSKSMSKRMGFMPGCSLPSYSPENIARTMEYLKQKFPDLSAIQKCCGKPTKALGQAEVFEQRFGSLVEDIKACNIEQMIVACQNCLKTLRESKEFETVSLWELIPQIGLPKELKGKAKDSDVVFTIHDSCSAREESKLHDGVRWILNELGYKTVEPVNTRENTRCCGFGGMVVPANPDLAQRVMNRRAQELPTEHIVVYCSACRSAMLTGGGKAWHLLDLVWGPVIYKGHQPPKNSLASPTMSWFNRFMSKRAITKIIG